MPWLSYFDMSPQDFNVVKGLIAIEAARGTPMLFHVIFVLMISQLEAANETPSKTFLISFVSGDVQIVVLLRVINFVAILAN